MYAVIKTGGKQHRVKPGDVIEVEKIVSEGETMSFQPLMVVDDDGNVHVGSEAAKGSVTAKPLGEKKGDKVKVFKYRPKSGYARRAGHRQLLTLLEIQDIKLGTGRKPAKRASAAANEPAAPEAATPEAAAPEAAAPEPAEDAE